MGSPKPDSNKWKRFKNKISKMMISLRKFNKDIDNNKKERISNQLLISRINKLDLVIRVRNNFQVQELITMVKKTIGIKELTISCLRIFDIFIFFKFLNLSFFSLNYLSYVFLYQFIWTIYTSYLNFKFSTKLWNFL